MYMLRRELVHKQMDRKDRQDKVPSQLRLFVVVPTGIICKAGRRRPLQYFDRGPSPPSLVPRRSFAVTQNLVFMPINMSPAAP